MHWYVDMNSLRYQKHTKSVARFINTVHTSTSMSFLSVASSSLVIFRHLYLLALKRKSWNWTKWELQEKLFILDSVKKRNITRHIQHLHNLTQNMISSIKLQIRSSWKSPESKIISENHSGSDIWIYGYQSQAEPPF